MDHARIKKLKDRFSKLQTKFENAVCNKEAEKYLRAMNKIKDELLKKYNVKL